MAGCRVYPVHRGLADPMSKGGASQPAESSLCIRSGLLIAEEHVADAVCMKTQGTGTTLERRACQTGALGGREVLQPKGQEPQHPLETVELPRRVAHLRVYTTRSAVPLVPMAIVALGATVLTDLSRGAPSPAIDLRCLRSLLEHGPTGGA